MATGLPPCPCLQLTGCCLKASDQLLFRSLSGTARGEQAGSPHPGSAPQASADLNRCLVTQILHWGEGGFFKGYFSTVRCGVLHTEGAPAALWDSTSWEGT